MSEGMDGQSSQWGASAVRIPRPSMQELPRLHQELGIWMAHTKYHLQPVERSPVWRVQNTSMTLSTGSGIGAYYLLKRWRPSLKFPFDILPPFIMFYLTHQAAQRWQLSGLYDSFLALSSPLGVQARQVLLSLRSGG
eukprot:CAMPEP_0168411650 /NCGR_PEP_ID=MMETSP0228-20121227/28308_1 /TAXON_ID=133427 /ORGANISM="Protoceratium reticulatum, Strain CCCM 535 (=CCMP 1889)" /LENGTH=136 /DNA_ID=CAMNT_0008425399 /DNA_START=69 /DNA_END=476 /DNA_ORIENTATION=+